MVRHPVDVHNRPLTYKRNNTFGHEARLILKNTVDTSISLYNIKEVFVGDINETNYEIYIKRLNLLITDNDKDTFENVANLVERKDEIDGHTGTKAIWFVSDLGNDRMAHILNKNYLAFEVEKNILKEDIEKIRFDLERFMILDFGRHTVSCYTTKDYKEVFVFVNDNLNDGNGIGIANDFKHIKRRKSKIRKEEDGRAVERIM